MGVAWNTIDRTGEVHNGWTIVAYSHTDRFNKRLYLCRCVCGHEIVKVLKRVLSGESKSCGCLNRKNHIKHGMSKSRIYKIWKLMSNRCYNPKATQYKYYGGRGIKVCDRWRNSFEAFLADMGEPPTSKHSIDRFPNNEGNYEPGNCRWATPKEQANNRRLPAPPNKP